MARVKERVSDSYDGCTIRNHKYESVGMTTTMVTLGDLEVSDVIQTLRAVAAGTDINAMYNPQDRVESNLIKGTGTLRPG